MTEETSTTRLLRFLDLEALPPTLLTIGYLLSDGFTQREIAAELGLTEARVSGEVTRLRCLLVAQLAEHATEMDEASRTLLRRVTGTA